MARNNRILHPKARAALDRLKYETAGDVGVQLNEGYNGDLTSKDAGQIGGNMVKKMIEDYEIKAENSGFATIDNQYNSST
jgi:hypothetical protein